MRPLKAAELLMVWERGLKQNPLVRALALLTAACPESDSETIATWPIGERDNRLMQLREWMFGPQLTSTAKCPQCAQWVEWDNHIADFRRQTAEGAPAADFDFSTAGYEVCFRLPTSKDVAAVLYAPGEEALQGLLTRCIISVRQGDRTCEVSSLPASVRSDLAQRMEKLDPLADIRIDLTCPQCSYAWSEQFDIVGYLWAEIDQWAQHTLNAVHRLATAYGWSERDILELNPVRRQLYLGMIQP